MNSLLSQVVFSLQVPPIVTTSNPRKFLTDIDRWSTPQAASNCAVKEWRDNGVETRFPYHDICCLLVDILLHPFNCLPLFGNLNGFSLSKRRGLLANEKKHSTRSSSSSSLSLFCFHAATAALQARFLQADVGLPTSNCLRRNHISFCIPPTSYSTWPSCAATTSTVFTLLGILVLR